MATFFFHTRDGITCESQHDSLQDAKREAARYLGRLIYDHPEKLWEAGDSSLAVSDERGLILFTIEVLGLDAPAISVSACA